MAVLAGLLARSVRGVRAQTTTAATAVVLLTTGYLNTDQLDSDVDRAWGVLGEARESGRFNPRRATAGRMNAAEGFVPILNRLAQAIAETRSMARTIRVARAPEEWDRSFREPWLDLLSRSGAAVAGADRAALAAARADLTALADRLHLDELRGLWPVYGALLVNLRNILDGVAEAQPVQVASSPPAPRQPVG